MRSIRHMLRAPLVLASFWLQVRQAMRHERTAHLVAWFRIHWCWLWNADGAPVTVRMFGFTVSAWDAGILRLLFKEIFIDRQYHFDPGTASPVIIDCGANIGMSVLWFKMRWPDARIIAIEANPSAFALLKKNVEQNGLTNVTLHNVAVADKEGTLDFFVNHEAGTLLGSVRAERGGEQCLRVPAILLSHILATLKERVDAVKLDIEGAEWMVLRDLVASGTLAIPRTYLVEYHHRVGTDKSMMSGFLKPFEEQGYDYSLVAGPGRSGKMQDVRLHFSR